MERQDVKAGAGLQAARWGKAFQVQDLLFESGIRLTDEEEALLQGLSHSIHSRLQGAAESLLFFESLFRPRRFQWTAAKYESLGDWFESVSPHPFCELLYCSPEVLRAAQTQNSFQTFWGELCAMSPVKVCDTKNAPLIFALIQTLPFPLNESSLARWWTRAGAGIQPLLVAHEKCLLPEPQRRFRGWCQPTLPAAPSIDAPGVNLRDGNLRDRAQEFVAECLADPQGSLVLGECVRAFFARVDSPSNQPT